MLFDLFISGSGSGQGRSDNGPEIIAQAVQDWIKTVGDKTAYITPLSPRENGYIGSFNDRLRDKVFKERKF